ncbi:MAG: hypothetical protein U0931_15920 [Vulcanimicrobiota bacterium]
MAYRWHYLLYTALALLWAPGYFAVGKVGGDPGSLMTVAIRAQLTADSHFRDGATREDETVALTYTETTVRRLFPVNDSSLDLKEVSHSGHVEADGRGNMVYGPGLPSLEWTFSCRQPEASLIRVDLKADRRHGVVGLENFLTYKSLNLKCSGGDPEQWRPLGKASGLLQEAWDGFCQQKSTNLPSLSLPFTLPGNSRTTSLNHVFEVKGEFGVGKLTLDSTISLIPPEGSRPRARLKAVARLAPTVQRGDPLVLDGSASVGEIKSYRWTFLPGDHLTGLTPPRSQAHKEGDVARVILLDSMKVRLTVSDGQTSDSQTVNVTVLARRNLRTRVKHHEEFQVAGWDSAPLPGNSNLAQATFRNDCESDPNQALEHVIHPDLDKGKAEDYVSLEALEDPGGPFDGYFYVKDWKASVQRKTMISRWLLPEGPPAVAGFANWFNYNGSSTAMYFLRRADRAAHTQTDRLRDYVTNQENDGSAGAGWAEKTYGADGAQLNQLVRSKLVDFEAKLRPLIHARVGVDAPTVQVWDPDSAQWKKVQVSF